MYPGTAPHVAPRASARQRVEGWSRGTSARKDTGMSEQSNAAAAGTIDVGGDLTVNRLGFGAMRITGHGVWGDPPDHDQAIATLRRALELGVNFIDTADSYGPDVSENLIAEALHPYPDDLVLATKGGYLRPGPNKWTPDGLPEHLRSACEGSLRRLRVEQIPLYQFHVPDPKVPYAESVGAIAELQKEGKIRHVGVSNVSQEQLREAQRIVNVVSVQNRYNVTDRSSHGGLNAARRLGATESQVVLAWMLSLSPAMLPIPGTGSPEHAAENIAAAGLALAGDG